MTEKLFTPFFVGPHQLKNRIVMPAMHLGMAKTDSDDASVSEGEIRFYKDRAEANVALVMAGLCNTYEDTSSTIKGVLALSTDDHITGMAKLARAINDGGALSAVQLSPIAGYNTPAWTPDAAELTTLIDSIGLAARRAEQAGFHFVELMLSGGSLLSHLLSSHHNSGQLPDYSGSLKNRLRAPLEAIQAIHRHAPRMPIIVRMHGHEYLENGYGLAEAGEIATRLEDAGAVAINVTVAGHRTTVPQITRQRSAESFSFLGRNIKDAVTIPVFYGSRIRNLDDATRVMHASGADAITVGRGLIADAHFARKLQKEFEENKPPMQDDNAIVNCIGCCQCLDMAFSKKPAHCTVNPGVKWGERTHTATRGQLTAALNDKRVVVAGSGPAGLHAAIDYATRGATVTLVEKADVPGGKWRRISQMDSHANTQGALSGTLAMLDHLHIQVQTGTALTPEFVKSMAPDILVLATGAAPRRIPLNGIETHPNVHHVSELVDSPPPEFRHAAIIGGNAAGVTMAIHLAVPGFATSEAIGYLHRFGNAKWAEEALSFKPAKQVSILKRRGFFGKGMGRATRWTAVQEMALYGINTLDKVTYDAVTKDGIHILRGKNKAPQFIKADLIILSTGFEPIVSPADYEHLVPDIRVVGDAHKIGNITDAINSVYEDEPGA